MDGLLLNEHTRRQALAFVDRPSHALLITGAKGSGKETLAKALVSTIFNVRSDNLQAYPYFRQVAPIDGKAIPIDTIRELDRFFALKIPAKSEVSRVVLVLDAGKLGIEAQNAFLKTLEEPPQGTLIVMTAETGHDVLPTIRSRTNILQVKRVPRAEVTEYWQGQGYDKAAIDKAYNMSGGLPGLMHALLTDDGHELVKATGQARDLLGMSAFERIAAIDAYAKDKEDLQNTLFILQQMAHVRLATAQAEQAEQWKKILEASYYANEALANSGQVKLVLTRMMLTLL